MHNNNELEQLMVAHMNRDLTQEERDRLQDLASKDPARRGVVAEMDAMHELLDAEAQLRAQVMAPAELGEEAGEGYARLAKAASRAEDQLRNQLRDQQTLQLQPGLLPERRRQRWLAVALAVAAAIILSLIFINHDGGPGLNGNTPENDFIGRQTVIILDPVIRRQDRSLSWGDVSGARFYDVSIVDANNDAVLQRDANARGSHSWQLTMAQFDLLSRHQGALYLRVVATDGAGIPVGSTGDLLLQVKP